MLFKAKFKKSHGLLDVGYEKDKFIFRHVQNVDVIKRRVQRIKHGNEKGWSTGKEFKMIASVPELEFLKHPEWATDEKALYRWLNSDEGRDYKVSNP